MDVQQRWWARRLVMLWNWCLEIIPHVRYMCVYIYIVYKYIYNMNHLIPNKRHQPFCLSSRRWYQMDRKKRRNLETSMKQRSIPNSSNNSFLEVVYLWCCAATFNYILGARVSCWPFTPCTQALRQLGYNAQWPVGNASHDYIRCSKRKHEIYRFIKYIYIYNVYIYIYDT